MRAAGQQQQAALARLPLSDGWNPLASPLAVMSTSGAFTGVFAHKPTYGRVPHFPASSSGTLAHVGPLTWSVEDAALLLEVISGPDSRGWSALPRCGSPAQPSRSRR